MKIFDWIAKHQRFYLSLFYIVTAILFVALAYYTHIQPPIYDSYFWFGREVWVVVYGVEAIYMGFMAATSFRLEATTKSLIFRGRQLGTWAAGLLIVARAINTYVAVPASTWFVFALPLWFFFLILWVRPLLWVLPARLEEYKQLRDRLDLIESRVKKLPNDQRVSDSGDSNDRRP